MKHGPRVWGILLTGSLMASVGAGTEPAGSALQVSVGTHQIVARDLTPRGEAIFFGVARRSSAWMQRVVPRISRVRTDGAGQAVLDLGGGVPPRSIWSVVDGETGTFGFGAPAGALLETALESTGEALLAGGSDVVAAQTDVELLVLRPGASAWYGRGSDGTLGDTTGAGDGRVGIDLETLVEVGSASVATTEAPRSIDAGDVVIAIDPRVLRVASLRVAGPGAER